MSDAKIYRDRPDYAGGRIDCRCCHGRTTWGKLVIHDDRYGERRLLLDGSVEEQVGDGEWVRVEDVEQSIQLLASFVVSLHEQLIVAGVLEKPELHYSLPGNGHHKRCVYHSDNASSDD